MTTAIPARAGSCLRRRQISQPFSWGTMMSSRTTSGRDSRASLRASVPFVAKDDVVAFLDEVVADKLGDVSLVLDEQHPPEALRDRRAFGAATAPWSQQRHPTRDTHRSECRASGLQDDDAAVNLG